MSELSERIKITGQFTQIIPGPEGRLYALDQVGRVWTYEEEMRRVRVEGSPDEWVRGGEWQLLPAAEAEIG